MARVAGKRIVVTGSSRGLGRAFAIALAREGASVVINGTNAHAVFQLFGEPQPSGTGFDIHIQSSPCG